MMKTFDVRVEKVLLAASLVRDLVATEVLLPGDQHTHTANIVATRDHHQLTNLKLQMFSDLATLDVHFHRVVHLNVWTRVPNSSAVVGHDVRDTLRSQCLFLNPAKLVL